MSNLTKALAVVSLLAPATGRPLSIGDIELHSALNQNLNAEIRLHVDAGENPGDILVRMAPPEKFDQAGIPWSFFLSKIKFEPVVQANGTVIVKVTSKETLTEPFLDFLLEVSWAQGNQFREFTLLIDPPASYNQPVIPVAGSNAYRAEAMEEAERPVRHARAAIRRPKHEGAASEINPQTPTSGEFGPTQASDTLWSISAQLGAERGVSAKQMMTALYRANPEAFNRSDMDSLKAGVILKIPETGAILKPSQKEAQPRNEQKVVRKEPAVTAKPLELAAPGESKIADNTQGQIKPGRETGAANAPAVAGEAGKAAEGKDLELQGRIEKLEQQLGMMQQLLALKDQQLAALQNAGKEAPKTQPIPAPAVEKPAAPAVQQPVAPAPVQPATPAPVVAQPAPAPVPTPKPAPQVQPAPAAQNESFFSSETYYLAIGGLGAGILSVLGWLLWRKRRIDEQTNTESMFASASQIRMPDSESSLSVPVMELGTSTAYDVGTVGESSFISDFTPSDFDAFDTDQSEVDPLSEADVYLAYGRYQQAEELIRNALNDEPDRDDFKLKLLEIFYAGENKQGFADYAQELSSDGKQGDRPFWSKVSEMAKEIVPDLPLFGGTPIVAAPQSPAVEEEIESSPVETAANAGFDESEFGIADDDLDNLSLSAPVDLSILDELDSEFSDLKRDSHASRPDDNSLDFDLSSSADSQAEQKVEAVAPSSDIESIDFDLSSLSFDDAAEKTEVESDQSAIESFDFNFDVHTEEKPADDANPETVLDLDLDQDLNLETYDLSGFGTDEPEVVTPRNVPEPAGEEPGEFDFNFDFDAPVVSSEGVDDFDLSVSDLTDMDEFETKIDLAKAYIDMGDANAAKLIAEEVLSKGSKEQKAAAQALLDELK